MRRKLWKRTGKTRRIDEAMGGAGVHGCRFMPALGLECKNQLVSRRLTLSKLGSFRLFPTGSQINTASCLSHDYVPRFSEIFASRSSCHRGTLPDLTLIQLQQSRPHKRPRQELLTLYVALISFQWRNCGMMLPSACFFSHHFQHVQVPRLRVC